MNLLLDYVYVETEPMQKVKRGDDLDFSTIEPVVRKKIEIKFDHSRLKNLRKSLAERVSSFAQDNSWNW